MLVQVDKLVNKICCHDCFAATPVTKENQLLRRRSIVPIEKVDIGGYPSTGFISPKLTESAMKFVSFFVFIDA